MSPEVNYIKHLNGVYTRMAEDTRLSPHHISLYLAIFQMWNLNHFRSPVSISRSEMKLLSKVGSNNTYSKCLRQLHDFGYINYQASHNPMIGSRVTCTRFDTTGDKTTGISQTQLAIPEKGASTKHPKPAQMKKKLKKIPPDLKEVKKYFTEDLASKGGANLSEEADKFFNHFTSNGWKVGGKSPMKDWKAAARNWLLNARRFADQKGQLYPKHLQTNSTKNYHEPL